MLKLPIARPLQYISPSTFNMLRQCELAAYYHKMAPEELPRQPQTEQMAMGSAFDSHVKAAIIHHYGWKEQSLALLLNSVDPTMLHMIEYSKAVFDMYAASGALADLFKIGIRTVESESKREMRNENGDLDFVLFGYPDAELNPPNSEYAYGVPSDWKVGGWQAAKPRSPKPGYFSYLIQDKENPSKFYEKGPHKDCGMPMEDIDGDWGIQLLMYSWFQSGYVKGLNPWVRLEQVLINPDWTVNVARYQTTISAAFSDEIYNKCKEIWARFSVGEIKDPSPGVWTCEPFGKPRACTLVCDKYKKTLGNPIQREILLAQNRR